MMREEREESLVEKELQASADILLAVKVFAFFEEMHRHTQHFAVIVYALGRVGVDADCIASDDAVFGELHPCRCGDGSERFEA